MIKKLVLLFLIVSIVFFVRNYIPFSFTSATGAPPYDPSSFDNVTESDEKKLTAEWKRPAGPVKIALQVGHWKTDEVPDELKRLRTNTGSSGGGKAEWEVNYKIAELTKELLEEKDIIVELLPATIPEHYWADVFVAIHADGSLDSQKSGYKAATPRRDQSRKAEKLLRIVESSYEKQTGLAKDPNVTRNMKGYYGFSWWRYDHAVHPMTTSLILETGFLTSPSDRTLLIGKPEVAARGLADGIIQFLTEEKLI